MIVTENPHAKNYDHEKTHPLLWVHYTQLENFAENIIFINRNY